jgi:anhydro-N-acetylmuramic acid kinase
MSQLQERPRIMRERIVAGAMSGTSADGVDVAVVRVSPPGRVELLAFEQQHYPATLQERIHDTRKEAQIGLHSLCSITNDVTHWYGKCANEAIRKSGVPVERIDAIGAHGQTLFHDPPLSMQVFDPSKLAIETGCAVVSDFRRADLALGGEGAPLVPFADAILFAHESRTRAIVNIGGIANVTVLSPRADGIDIRAFDTGPGNCVSDDLARSLDTELFCDDGGEFAMRGTVDERQLKQLLSDNYFTRPAPKSTDGPAMLDVWERVVGTRERGTYDQFATAAAWCADAIARSIPPDADVFVAGGGIHNAAIMHRLRTHFPTLKLTDELGIPSAAREAIAFALLTCATLDGIPGNVPGVTGASRRVILGSITKA